MTADLRDQMRELCAFIEDEQGSITVDDVRTRTSDAPVSTVSPVPISEITITEDAVFDLLQPVESATRRAVRAGRINEIGKGNRAQ